MNYMYFKSHGWIGMRVNINRKCKIREKVTIQNTEPYTDIISFHLKKHTSSLQCIL